MRYSQDILRREKGVKIMLLHQSREHYHAPPLYFQVKNRMVSIRKNIINNIVIIVIVYIIV